MTEPLFTHAPGTFISALIGLRRRDRAARRLCCVENKRRATRIEGNDPCRAVVFVVPERPSAGISRRLITFSTDADFRVTCR
jgi:hypothetical protein